MTNPDLYDVAIVGGGPAGLAGGVALARSLRRVVLIDDAHPRNEPAAHAHNVLGHEGIKPTELDRIGRDEFTGYGGTVIDGRVESGHGGSGGFTLSLADGSTVGARRVLLAGGARDVLPAVDGLAERFGRDVLHCPYCHGYEVRGQRIGVLSTLPMTAHQALMFRQLSEHVTVLLHTGPRPTDDEVAQLRARGVTLVDGEVTAVEVVEDRLVGVVLAEGGRVALDAVVVATRVEALPEPATSLGLKPMPFEMNGVEVGTVLPADQLGRTEVPGVWIAGNAATPMAQVVSSAAAGVMAGAQINFDLILAETAAALDQERSR